MRLDALHLDRTRVDQRLEAGRDLAHHLVPNRHLSLKVGDTRTELKNPHNAHAAVALDKRGRPIGTMLVE